MARCPQFAELLNQAFERIKEAGETKESIKTEIAHAIGKGVHLIEYWQRGNCPATHTQAEIAARILFDKKGLINKEEVELFLEFAGHPSSSKVWNSWFVKLESPPADEFGIFIGREEKIEELRNVLQPGRVVVLWGPGGVGKTSLVREVIQNHTSKNTISQRFPDGILYYEFSAQEHSADEAFRYIARFYGVEVLKEMSPRDAASEALKDKRALIILDGTEEADELRKVWRICHQCGMLIVSRHEYSDLSSMTIYLDLLSPDEAIAALRAWSTDLENQSDFQTWKKGIDEDYQIARKICEELGRLPLALRLAGRYMLRREVNLVKFLELWQEWKLELLNAGKDQHDSLQVLMEKSLEHVCQVSDDARAIIAVAGLLPYQLFTIDVIAAALEKSTEKIDKLIRDLWKFSLLRRFYSEIHGESWEFTHKLIYTYAQSLNIGNGIVARLAVHYTELLNEESDVRNLEDILKSDLGKIRAVINHCLKRQLWEKAQNLILTCFDADLEFGSSYYGDDGRAILQAGLTVAKVRQDCEAKYKFLMALGKDAADRCSDDFPDLQKNRAINYYQQALDISQELDDWNMVVEVLFTVSTMYKRLDAPHESLANQKRLQKMHTITRKYYEQALAISEKIWSLVCEGPLCAVAKPRQWQPVNLKEVLSAMLVEYNNFLATYNNRDIEIADVFELSRQGMTIREIQAFWAEHYGVEVSLDLIAEMTDAVMAEVKEWQNRPLERLYPVVIFEALHVRIQDEAQVKDKTVYLAVGIHIDGKREILGLWIEQTEGTKFWLRVMTALKNRGVEDMLIAVAAGLKGFAEAINAVFPQTEVQQDIVQLLRNSRAGVTKEDSWDIIPALMGICQAENAAVAAERLEAFAASEWGQKYPMIAPLWRRHWTQMISFLAYPQEVRSLLAATHRFPDSLNMSLRKLIQHRGHFPNEVTALNLLSLVSSLWDRKSRLNWRRAQKHFAILFGERWTAGQDG